MNRIGNRPEKTRPRPKPGYAENRVIFIFRNDAGVFMRPDDSDPLPFFSVF